MAHSGGRQHQNNGSTYPRYPLNRQRPVQLHHLQPITHAENTAEMLARNSYLKRIAELEEVIKEINPNHEILNRIRMN